jgi:hypothetical protein
VVARAGARACQAGRVGESDVIQEIQLASFLPTCYIVAIYWGFKLFFDINKSFDRALWGGCVTDSSPKMSTITHFDQKSFYIHKQMCVCRNNIDRVLERRTLIAVGRYPIILAKERIKRETSDE